jgi:hypothetical protein
MYVDMEKRNNLYSNNIFLWNAIPLRHLSLYPRLSWNIPFSILAGFCDAITTTTTQPPYIPIRRKWNQKLVRRVFPPVLLHSRWTCLGNDFTSQGIWAVTRSSTHNPGHVILDLYIIRFRFILLYMKNAKLADDIIVRMINWLSCVCKEKVREQEK